MLSTTIVLVVLSIVTALNMVYMFILTGDIADNYDFMLRTFGRIHDRMDELERWGDK